MPKKLLLVVLDGWGVGPHNDHNAIFRADTPYLDRLPSPSRLVASGEAVGLLPNQMGSSEVGHMHIGAGRVIRQELTRIHASISDKSFFNNPALLAACEHAKNSGTTLHLVGFVSDGGIHSHINHLFALIELARSQQVPRVAIHAILDGRDSPPQSALKYLNQLTVKIQKEQTGVISTLMGRFYADRNNHWDRTQVAIDALVKGIGHRSLSMVDAVSENHQRNIVDEFIEPTILAEGYAIKPEDSVVFYNFRADRMRQMVERLADTMPSLTITTMIPYGVVRDNITVAFPRQVPSNHFSEVVSHAGLKQLKIAETQKYAHLTYFFNGTREEPYPGEDRIMVPSKSVTNFAQTPEMSAREITTAAISALDAYDVVTVNYANADMVGHTGNIDAAIVACTTIDECLQELVPAAHDHGYSIIITADHGNAEQMFDPLNNTRHTAHTINPVPLWLVAHTPRTLKPEGGLTNVAALALSLLGIAAPSEMDPSL